MQHIRGFIFDLDGTLVTSSLDFPEIKREIGCPLDDDALSYIEQLSQQEQDEAMAIIHRHEMADAEACEWMPGAQAFIDQCAKASIPTAIVTRNSARASQVKIEKNGIKIPILVTREHSKPKPDPSALLDIAERFGLAPAQVLMVGDYRYDLEAGRNASMPSCLVHYDELPDYAEIADFTFENFDQLHEAVFGVPQLK